MTKQRKHYTPAEKVAILRRHLFEQVPISELCDKHGLQPTVFYPLAEGVLRERSGHPIS
jgi:transposase-like protein